MKSFGPISIVSLFNPSCFQHVAPFQLRYVSRSLQRNDARKEISRIRNSLEAGPIRSTSSSLPLSLPPPPGRAKGGRKLAVKTLRINFFPLFATRARRNEGEAEGKKPGDDAVSSWRKIWIIPAICIRKISRRSTFPAHLSPCLPLPSSRGNYLSRKFRGNYRVVRRFIELQV